MLNKSWQVILASGSPRRTMLMNYAGIEHQVIVPDVEERALPDERPVDYVRRNAKLKADRVIDMLRSPGDGSIDPAAKKVLVVSADTIVCLRDQILEKPLDSAHAVAMLKSLSGQMHQVLSGICLSSWDIKNSQSAGLRQEVFDCRTKVHFKKLSEDEIHRYVATGEAMDKAGSYAAQGQGCYMIAKIIGSYTNVIGLPMAELCQAMSEFNES